MLQTQQITAELAEQGILACLILDCKLNLPRLIDYGITQNSFNNTTYKELFKVIKEMVDEGYEVEIQSLLVYISGKGLNDQFGGWKGLHAITKDVDSSLASQDWLKLVKRSEVMRAGQTLALIVQDAQEHQPPTAEKYLELIDKQVNAMRNLMPLGATRRVKWDEVEDDKGVVPTRFYELDSMLDGGYKKTEFNIIAARPGVGKTTLAIQLSLNALQLGLKVVLVSLEMSESEIKMKMLSNLANKGTDFVKPWVREKNPAIMPIIEQASKFNLQIWSDTAELNAMLNRVALENANSPIDLLIVDYIGLVQTNHKHSLYEKMTFITQALKRLAMLQNISVLGLAQLNRDVEKSDREPILADLRDSGSIEQDANSVLFIYKDKDEQHNLILRKNRNGRTGSVKVEFVPAHNKFR
jgi:replicative DNA helicase